MCHFVKVPKYSACCFFQCFGDNFHGPFRQSNKAVWHKFSISSPSYLICKYLGLFYFRLHGFVFFTILLSLESIFSHATQPAAATLASQDMSALATLGNNAQIRGLACIQYLH